MSGGTPLDVVGRLARALDADDFDTVRSLLHPDVTYRIGHDEHRGPESVVRSYSDGSRRARTLFDEVDFDHTVVGLVNDRTVRVDFADRLQVAEDVLVHHSVQDFEVGQEPSVVSIVDQPVPGQREQVADFLMRHGLASPSVDPPTGEEPG